MNDPPVAVDDTATTPEDTPVSGNLLVNDSDVDGDPLTLTSFTISGNTYAAGSTVFLTGVGSIVVNSDGSFTFTPAPNYTGAVPPVDYAISDGHGGTDIGTLIITITSVNDAPVAIVDYYSTNEDTPLSVVLPGVMLNDSDSDAGDLLTVSMTGTATSQGGTVTLNANGSFLYTPALNFNGTDTYIYNLCDNGIPVLCDTAIVKITVLPVNDPPVANDDSGTTPEDTQVVICVPGNDTDAEGLNLGSVNITVAPLHGEVSINSTTGCVTYTPDPDYNGTDEFEYEICDTGGLCAQASVTITVTSVDDVPNAVNDISSTSEDTSVSIPVLNNDTFGGDGPSTGTISVFTGPTHGTATVDNKGTAADPTDDEIIYTPALNYSGPDQLTYEICDSDGDCDVAVVNITVTAVNDPPVAVDDTATTPEDTPVSGNLLVNDSDVDGDPLTLTSFTISGNTYAAGSTVFLTGVGSIVVNSDGSFTFTPAPNYTGAVPPVDYAISDGHGGTDIGTLIITITSVNDAPVAIVDYYSTNEDTPLSVVLPGVMLNDSDSDAGDLLTVSMTGTATSQGGTVTLNANGSFLYTPALNFNGTDTYIYNLCDNGIPVLCDTAIVKITVLPVNDPPVANDDSGTTPEDTQVVICVPGNDTDAEGLNLGSVNITVAPLHGEVSINSTTGCVTYTPDPDYNGTDEFEYEICDTGGLCAQASVTITVTSVDDVPNAVNDISSTSEDTSVSIPVLNNDTFGGDGPSTGTISVFTGPTHGTATVDNKGTAADPTDDEIIYTPALNYSGPDQLTYEICDSDGDCDVAVVNITVTAVNDPPVAVDDTATTPEDTPVSGNLLVNDSDVDGDPLTLTSFTISGNTYAAGSTVFLTGVGSIVVNSDGSFTFTPAPNYTGAVPPVDYAISDGHGGTDIGTLIITITSVNDAPVAIVDYYSTNEDTPLSVVLPGVMLNDSDSDAGDLLTVSMTGTATSQGGTVTLNANGSFLYTPALNFNGTDTYIYNLCDNGIPVLCDTAIVKITVLPVNDPPVANDDSGTTPRIRRW